MKLGTMAFIAFIVLFLGFVVLATSGVITSAQITANVSYFGHFYVLLIELIVVAAIFGILFYIIGRVAH